MACRRIEKFGRDLRFWPLVGPTRATARRASVACHPDLLFRMKPFGENFEGFVHSVHRVARFQTAHFQHLTLGVQITPSHLATRLREMRLSSSRFSIDHILGDF